MRVSLLLLIIFIIPFPIHALTINLTNQNSGPITGDLKWYAYGTSGSIDITSYCSFTEAEVTLEPKISKEVTCILKATNIPGSSKPLTIYAEIVSSDGQVTQTNKYAVPEMCDSESSACGWGNFCYLSEKGFPKKSPQEIIEAIGVMADLIEGLPEIDSALVEKGCLPNDETLKSKLGEYFGDAQMSIKSVNSEGIELEIENDLSKYKEKAQEQVFRRYFDDVAFKVTLTGMDSNLVSDLQVEIYKGNYWLSWVYLSKLSDGSYTGSWDYHTPTVIYSNGLPVGKYTARVVLEEKSGNRVTSKDKYFYVIFGPPSGLTNEEWKAYLYDSDGGDKDEHGVWFTSAELKDGRWWYGKDVGNIYYLHPFDREVFLKAMDVVDGETSESKAASKLLDYEAGMFGYTISANFLKGSDSEDVLDMFGKLETPLRKELGLANAQCKDDASVLTALLRSAGIPAHTVTADANHDLARWNFDTWVEAWLGGRWWVFHSHWPEGKTKSIGPSSRDDVGQNMDYLGKDVNDIIITANGKWTVEDLNRYSVNFRYFQKDGSGNDKVPANEPKHGRPYPVGNDEDYWYMSGWITELSRDYWGVTHDDPPGNLEEKPLVLGLDKKNYNAGDTARINLTLKNVENVSRQDLLNLTLFLQRPKSKYRENIDSLILEIIELVPGEIISKQYGFKIPNNFSSEDIYFLEASYGQDEDAITIEVVPGFDAELLLPEQVIENSTFKIKAKIAKRDELALENVTLCLGVSYNLNITGEICKTLGEVSSSNYSAAEWNISALEGGIGTAILEVSSENAGGNELTKYFEIEKSSRLELLDSGPYVFNETGVWKDFCFYVKNIGGLPSNDTLADIILPEFVSALQTSWNVGAIEANQKKLICTQIMLNRAENFSLEANSSNSEGKTASLIFSAEVISDKPDLSVPEWKDLDKYVIGLGLVFTVIAIYYLLRRYFRKEPAVSSI